VGSGLTVKAKYVHTNLVAYDTVLAAGGRKLGDIVSVEIPGAGKITFVYAADPEGNIIELQEWAR